MPINNKIQLGREKVRSGRTQIPLNVPQNVPLGEYPLNVEYEENNVYEQSNAYGFLRLYNKVWILLPTIYVYRSEDYATLEAYLFNNSDYTVHGRGKFKVNQVTVSDEQQIINGHTSYDYDITKYRDKPETHQIPYAFTYGGNEEHKLIPVKNEDGRVIFMDCPTNKTALKIHSYVFMGLHNETITLVARVYRYFHSGQINQDDIPTEGSINWYIGNNKIGTSTIMESGFTTLNYTITQNEGAYEIRIEYMPPTNSEKYCIAYGSGILHVQRNDIGLPHATANIPHQALGTTCTFTATISDITRIEQVQLYIDDQLCLLNGLGASNYKQTITNKTPTFTFDIPLEPDSYRLWAYPGYHVIHIHYHDVISDVDRIMYLTTFFITHPSQIDFDEIGRDLGENNSFYSLIYNKKRGIPIQTKDVVGHVSDEQFPTQLINEGDLTLIMGKCDTNIDLTVSTLNIKVDESVTFNAYLESNTEIEIPYRSITFTTGETSGYQLTDNTGHAVYTKQFTEAGTYPCIISYPGNTYENGSTYPTVNVTVVKRPTVMTIEIISAPWIDGDLTDRRIYYGQSVKLSVTLTEDVGTPVPNASIRLRDSRSSSTYDQTVTTNSQGHAEITSSLTNIASYDIRGTFTEDRKYLGCRGSVGITFRVIPYPVQLIVTPQQIEIGQNIIYQFALLDELQGTGIADTNIYDGNAVTVRAITDSQGDATWDTGVVAQNKGTYSNYFMTKASGRYAGSGLIYHTITINGLPVVLTFTGSKTNPDGVAEDDETFYALGHNKETYNGTLKVRRSNGNLIALDQLSFTVTHKRGNTTIETLNLTTDSNGAFTFDRVYRDYGTHTLTIHIPDSEIYDEFNYTATVEVIAATPDLTISSLPASGSVYLNQSFGGRPWVSQEVKRTPTSTPVTKYFTDIVGGIYYAFDNNSLVPGSTGNIKLVDFASNKYGTIPVSVNITMLEIYSQLSSLNVSSNNYLVLQVRSALNPNSSTTSMPTTSEKFPFTISPIRITMTYAIEQAYDNTLTLKIIPVFSQGPTGRIYDDMYAAGFPMPEQVQILAYGGSNYRYQTTKNFTYTASEKYASLQMSNSWVDDVTLLNIYAEIPSMHAIFTANPFTASTRLKAWEEFTCESDADMVSRSYHSASHHGYGGEDCIEINPTYAMTGCLAWNVPFFLEGENILEYRVYVSSCTNKGVFGLITGVTSDTQTDNYVPVIAYDFENDVWVGMNPELEFTAAIESRVTLTPSGSSALPRDTFVTILIEAEDRDLTITYENSSGNEVSFEYTIPDFYNDNVLNSWIWLGGALKGSSCALALSDAHIYSKDLSESYAYIDTMNDQGFMKIPSVVLEVGNIEVVDGENATMHIVVRSSNPSVEPVGTVEIFYGVEEVHSHSINGSYDYVFRASTADFTDPSTFTVIYSNPDLVTTYSASCTMFFIHPR